MTRAVVETRSSFEVAATVVLVAGALVLSIIGAEPAGSTLPGSREYSNPVHDADFPDPFVLRDGSRYYAYATQGSAANIQIITSADLVTWVRLGTALPLLPDWALDRHTWAPSVLATGQGHVLYYTVIERRSGLFCISAAAGRGPEGPFLDRSTEPLVCQRSRGGTIDPSAFTDADGAHWLLFKSNGVEGKEPTRLWSQRLSADGLKLVGPRQQLLVTDRAWEEPVIENPAMVRGDGTYFLFYSANRWYSASYAVGWARCTSPAGPCHKPDEGPLMVSTDTALGPGGADFFTAPSGGQWIAYHAWSPPHTSYPWGWRSLRIDKIAFAQGRPWVDAPSSGPVSFSFSPGPPKPPPPPPPAPPAPALPPPDAAPPPGPAPAPAPGPPPPGPAPASPVAPPSEVVTSAVHGPMSRPAPLVGRARTADAFARAAGRSIAAADLAWDRAPASPSSPDRAGDRPSALLLLAATAVAAGAGAGIVGFEVRRRRRSPGDGAG